MGLKHNLSKADKVAAHSPSEKPHTRRLRRKRLACQT